MAEDREASKVFMVKKYKQTSTDLLCLPSDDVVNLIFVSLQQAIVLFSIIFLAYFIFI